MKTFGVFVTLACLFCAGNGFAQTNTASEVASTNQLSVSLWIPRQDEVRHAPANISLVAHVISSAAGQPGDVARVEFYANDKMLGAADAIWRKGIHPDIHSKLPQPMIVSRPGFSMAAFTWTNAPAGAYTLTAHVSATNALAAVSAPLSLTISP